METERLVMRSYPTGSWRREMSGNDHDRAIGEDLEEAASCRSRPYLADNETQPRHVALQLGQGVWRQRHALRGMHGCKTLGGLAQGWFEVPNAQPGQGGLYPIHNPRAFPDQAVALAVRP